MARKLWFSLTKSDFDVQTFKAGGKGGQSQNTTDSGVRIVHRASGAVGEARDTRSQHRNKRAAFRRLTESNEFKLWLQRLAFEHDTTDYSMTPENLRVEVRDEQGVWHNEH